MYKWVHEPLFLNAVFSYQAPCLVDGRPNELLNEWVPVYNSYIQLIVLIVSNDHYHKQEQQQEKQTICQRMWLSVMNWD